MLPLKLSECQVTGNPAHINRGAKKKERKKEEEGGRTEDEEQRMREFGSGHISCLPLPPRPTTIIIILQRNAESQDLGDHEHL